jgi:integrase
VSFGENTAQALRNWLFVRPQKHRVTGVYVFSLNGEYMNPEQISQIIRRNCHRIGLRSLGAHSLRHRKGHQFADARIAPTIAAVALGHADVTTTLSHYYPDDYESADRALRELSQDNPLKTKIVQFPARSSGTSSL